MAPDLSNYFIDSAGRDVPLLVEHATGEPKFAIVNNQYVPYAEWKASIRRPASGPRGMTIASGDGAFRAGITVN